MEWSRTSSKSSLTIQFSNKQSTTPRPLVYCNLELLLLPSGRFVILDFITRLPPPSGSTIILVVVNCFPEGQHFGHLPTHLTDNKVSLIFIDMVYKLHRFQRSLISGPFLYQHFWQKLLKLSGTKLHMSTAYHLQSDGKIGVLNRVIELYLCPCVHGQPSQWLKFLNLAEWCFNNTSHFATRITPFKATFGKSPHNIPIYFSGSSHIKVVDSFIHKKICLPLLLANCIRLRKLRKAYVDSHCHHVSYKIGDRV